MSKLTIKITLNSNDPFDAVIINRIQNEAHKPAVMKHFAYEAIQGRSLVAVQVVESGGQIEASAAEGGLEARAREINQQADRLLDSF